MMKRGIHFMPRIHSAFLLCVPVGLVSVLLAQDSRGPNTELAELVCAVADAKTANDASEASVKLFKGADRKKLERLKQIKEDGVALRAAWHEVQLGGTPRSETDVWGNVKLVEKTAAARFLGFIEGRLSVAVPKWWEASVSEAFRPGDDGEILAGQPKSPYRVIKKPRLSITSSVSREVSNGVTTLSCGNQKVALSHEVTDRFVKKRTNLAVLIHGDICVLAPHSDVGYSYPLACIDRPSGKMGWEASVWGLAVEGGATGTWFQYAEIVANHDRVFVIGVVNFCFYLGRFRSQDWP